MVKRQRNLGDNLRHRPGILLHPARQPRAQLLALLFAGGVELRHQAAAGERLAVERRFSLAQPPAQRLPVARAKTHAQRKAALTRVIQQP